MEHPVHQVVSETKDAGQGAETYLCAVYAGKVPYVLSAKP
jgi:hypothetical protein